MQQLSFHHFLRLSWLEDKSIHKVGGGKCNFYILYTFQALYLIHFQPYSAEKIQQQVPNIQRRSSSRFRTFNREDPAADFEHSAENPATDLAAATDFQHSAEDPAAYLAADAATINIHFFDLIHYFHNQVKKIMNRILQPHVHNSHPFLKG